MGNWEAVAAAVKAGALAGLNRTIDLVEERAKQKAPVRSIFEGSSRVRFKTMAEVKADREVRRRLGLGREYVAAPRTRLRSRRGMTKAKISTSPVPNVPVFRILRNGSLTPAAQARLTRRGLYEVRSQRALHNGQIGGRLRDEIYAEHAAGEGSRFEGRVVSPTPYAKYQEFGTSHNAAHPYLRPSLHESRGALRQNVRAGVRAGVRGQRIAVTEQL